MHKEALTRYFCLLILLSQGVGLIAQEFLFEVTVQAPQNENIEAERFEELEEMIREFINTTKFTDIRDVEDYEKIRGNININIGEEIDQANVNTQENFRAEMLINARRPVHNSNYETQTYYHQDDNFTFEFLVGSNMIFSEQLAYQNNLTSVITYYLFAILALDFDSFSDLGGEKYWNSLNDLISQIPSGIKNADPGWQPNPTGIVSKGNRNVYVQNALSPVMNDFRQAWYRYHRLGLDIMSDTPDEGRANILSALRIINAINETNPGMMFTQVFFDTKANEIVSVFGEGSKDQRKEVFDICTKINPNRRSIYSQLTRS